jgi:hypothetical protein
MGNSRKSDWPVLFFGLLLVGALLTAFIPSSVRAQQPPLREGCRAVSKLEYDTAKREYILISKGGRYVQTGHSSDAIIGGATSSGGGGKWGSG